MELVALVGRPNVGKSTLFNRLTGVDQAITVDTPGVTRDRIYGKCDWNGKFFEIVDTGGFIPGSEDTMEAAIRRQAMIAIQEANVIVLICDGKEGVTSFDMDIANILRQSGKPLVLAVNKCDNAASDINAIDFYQLGIGEPIPISSSNGHNTGDFLDEVVKFIVNANDEDEDERLKIAFVGRPNSGKSSLTNAFLGEDRMIVTDIPGTTRDSIDSIVKYYGEEIILIDTAGLRRKAQVKENIELYSTIRTHRAIERCDVAIVLIDATRGIEEQDKKIINECGEARKGMILAINKWDIKEKDYKTADDLMKKYKEEMKTFDYIPMFFVSAITKQRIYKLLDEAKKVKISRKTRISTSKLNDVMLPILEKTPPPSVRGHDLRINYITQTGTEPPVFAFFCNFPDLLPDSYKRFIENRMREVYDFSGTPISFIFRRKNKNWEDLKKNK